MCNAKWIWYPGDMELYYGLKQNFSRVERGMGWPAFWKSEGYRNRIVLTKTFNIKETTTFIVFPGKYSVGYCLVGERKEPFNKEIKCKPGRIKITIHLGAIETFPAVYVKGDIIFSDETWQVHDYVHELQPVGWSRYFNDEKQDISVWNYTEKIVMPSSIKQINGGVLFSFDSEMTAILEVSYKNGNRPGKVYVGETEAEALDISNCYTFCEPDNHGICEKNAVHFAFIPECKPGDLKLIARYQYVDIPTVAICKAGDDRLRKIWAIAERTFKLCSGIFYIDGIKRDRWIWGGDAYQSMLVGNVLFKDADINRRTYRALFGNQSPAMHINTIVDYSMLCIIGVKQHCDFYNDNAFLLEMYPKLSALTELLIDQTDDNGFLYGRDGDWLFIDWADFDRTGPLAAEQMLLAKTYDVMSEVEDELGNSAKSVEYKRLYDSLMNAINKYYWNEALEAYIDSFESGENHVTRHANIFAIFFDLVDDDRKKLLIENVLLNEAIPKITTPYFKFFEQDALCKTGFLDVVLREIHAYWGGMLDLGADTFWEEYDPSKELSKQYEMYGDPFGKSMCHAWAASPIYLIDTYLS